VTTLLALPLRLAPPVEEKNVIGRRLRPAGNPGQSQDGQPIAKSPTLYLPPWRVDEVSRTSSALFFLHQGISAEQTLLLGKQIDGTVPIGGRFGAVIG
jgi:hypothetical protein